MYAIVYHGWWWNNKMYGYVTECYEDYQTGDFDEAAITSLWIVPGTINPED